jgi:hypothetical protein
MRQQDAGNQRRLAVLSPDTQVGAFRASLVVIDGEDELAFETVPA